MFHLRFALPVLTLVVLNVCAGIAKGAQTSILAFSDRNDLLSYPVPPDFVDDHMESRLCPRITNVTLNVAEPVSPFGISEAANPLTAHSGYDHDERVIALMTHGLGQAETSEIVKKRCTWLRTIDE